METPIFYYGNQKNRKFYVKKYMTICGLNWSLRSQFKVKMCFFRFSSEKRNLVMTYQVKPKVITDLDLDVDPDLRIKVKGHWKIIKNFQ